jgi:hypothetical protein
LKRSELCFRGRVPGTSQDLVGLVDELIILDLSRRISVPNVADLGLFSGHVGEGKAQQTIDILLSDITPRPMAAKILPRVH